jgi:hypothetical protein
LPKVAQKTKRESALVDGKTRFLHLEKWEELFDPEVAQAEYLKRKK